MPTRGGGRAGARRLGVPRGDAAAALGGCEGVARRFERRGEAAGVTVVDDYAHLPTEVAAAIEAGRTGPWDRVVAVFQPHRYSRTAELWRGFADAFAGADVLAVTDVYAAGEAPRPGVSGKLIVDAVLDAHPWASGAWLPRLDDVVTWLRTPGKLEGRLPREPASGEATHESTDRGWIAYLNDLHKGRNAGPWWSWFIDLFAVAALVFSLSGLFLLQMHARHRPSTWPMVGLGVLRVTYEDLSVAQYVTFTVVLAALAGARR